MAKVRRCHIVLRNPLTLLSHVGVEFKKYENSSKSDIVSRIGGKV